MIQAMRPMVLLALVFAMFSAGGCSSGPNNRQRITGTVTLKGIPLDQGTIQFQPTNPENGSGSGALIKDGKYVIERDKGLTPGAYLVRISSGEQGTVETEEAPGQSLRPPAKERIPAKYNAKSEITREVTSKGPNTFDFAID